MNIKTIGIMGGMASVQRYQNLAAEMTSRRLAESGLPDQSPEILSRIFDFTQIDEMRLSKNWEGIAYEIGGHAKALADGKADAILIANNGLHKVIKIMTEIYKIETPIINIVDAMADAIKKSDVKKVGLIGNNRDFYKEQIINSTGAEIIVPPDADIQKINSIIKEKKLASSERYLTDVCRKLACADKVDAIAIGCTQMGAVVKANWNPLEWKQFYNEQAYKNTHFSAHMGTGNLKTALLLDSAIIHVRAAVDFALKDLSR